MDCSLPGSSVRGILQASSGLPFPSSGGLPNPGIEPTSLTFPALAGGFFTSSATWEAQALKILVCTSKAKIIPELPSKGNQQNPSLNSIPCFFFFFLLKLVCDGLKFRISCCSVPIWTESSYTDSPHCQPSNKMSGLPKPLLAHTPGSVEPLIPIPEGWTPGKQADWYPSFHSAVVCVSHSLVFDSL